MKKTNNSEIRTDVLHFRKWSRKGFSVFKTLKRVVLISVLTLNYFSSVPVSGMVVLQDTTEVKTDYSLEEIEISAQRSPAMYSQIARVITVIDKKEIEKSPFQSVQDLLEYAAGVDIRQRGAEGVQADVNVRGGTFDQTLILLNGINITDPQTGHHNLNIPVSLNQIERIEILEGPAARVYGPNAFAGAVNIVTNQNTSNSLKVQLTGGSYKYFDGDFSGIAVTGKLSHSLSLNKKKSSGYIENTDFDITSLFYSNQFGTNSGNLNFQAGFIEKGFGANSFYTPKYPNQFEKTKTFITSIKWVSKSNFHFTPVLYWRRNQDKFELFRENPPSWYTKDNHHLTNTFGGNLNSWIQSPLGKTSFGVEFRSENILSNVLGEDLDTPEKVPGENAEFTKGKTRNTTSGFFEHVYYLNNWTLSGGLLINYISESNLGLNFFPGIEAGYQINPVLKLFSSFNTSLRMPTFTDLYYSGPTNIGNPELKPEKTLSFESGLKLNIKYVQGNLTGFYRKGTDLIDWIKLNEADVWRTENLTRINSYGAEINVQFNLSKMVGGYMPESTSLSYFFNYQNKEESDIISYYVLDNLRQKFAVSVSKSFLNHFYFGLNVLFQDREGTYTQFVDNNWGEEIGYKPFWLFDGKLNCNLKKINLFMSVNNIFNTNYVDIGNIPQPGRWLKFGISWELNQN